MDYLESIIKTIEATVGRTLTRSEKDLVQQDFKSLILSIDTAVIKEINAFVRKRNIL